MTQNIYFFKQFEKCVSDFVKKEFPFPVITYAAHFDAARLLPRFSEYITDDENFCWQEKSGGHDFGIWNLGFFNLAKIFGKPTK